MVLFGTLAFILLVAFVFSQARVTISRMTPPCLNPAYSPSRSRRYLFNAGPSAELVNQRTYWDFAALLKGKRMLEIGGPTSDIDIYTFVASADNVVFRNRFAHFGQRADDLQGEVLGNSFDGQPFTIGDDARAGPRKIIGTVYQRHGAHLQSFLDQSYDVVFACHTLEHFVDPLRALVEWDRVLRSGGYLFLMLPFAPRTFDRDVTPGRMEELLNLYHSNASNNEALLLARLDARLQLFPNDYDLSYLWPEAHVWVNATWDEKRLALWKSVVSLCHGSPEEQCRNPQVDESLWHWHVWDFDLIQEAVGDCLGYEILWMQFHEPYHQLMLARKP